MVVKKIQKSPAKGKSGLVQGTGRVRPRSGTRSLAAKKRVQERERPKPKKRAQEREWPKPKKIAKHRPRSVAKKAATEKRARAQAKKAATEKRARAQAKKAATEKRARAQAKKAATEKRAQATKAATEKRARARARAQAKAILFEKRSLAAKKGAKTKARHAKLLKRQASASIVERARAMVAVAIEQGALPKPTPSGRSRRTVDTVFRTGQVFRRWYGKILTDALVEQVLYDLAVDIRRMKGVAFHVTVFELLTYGNKRVGGSPTVLVPVWWAPDAAETVVEYLSTGEQTNLARAIDYARHQLEGAVSEDDASATVLCAVITSGWRNRTPPERSLWMKRNRRPMKLASEGGGPTARKTKKTKPKPVRRGKRWLA